MGSNIVDILIKDGIITEEQHKKAIKFQKALNRDVPIEKILIQLGIITKDVIDSLQPNLQEEKPSEEIVFEEDEVDRDFVQKTPEKLIKDFKFIPFKLEDEGTLYVAVVDELNYKASDELRRIYNARKIKYLKVDSDTISKTINKAFSFVIDDEQDGDEDEVDNLMSENSPIIKFVNDLLTAAVYMDSSDIHIEPQLKKNTRVRLRIDGELVHHTDVPRKWHNQVISRIKIMANLDISKRFEPQDGEIKMKQGEQYINMRVSILPLNLGEKVVIRILPKADKIVSLENIGFSEKNLELVKQAIAKKQGLILVVGPTGSGKTTTMYGMLQALNSPYKNISTIEDPVEIDIAGLNQVQVTKKISFKDTLRALLRQDPDTIMVGEIRDGETAEISISASLTGHMVLSTLHTNNAIATITRLVDMGIEPYLLADALLMVISQRLAKRICPYCKEEDVKGLEHIHKRYPETVNEIHHVYHGAGCKECNQSGNKGRVALQEVLNVDEGLKTLMVSNNIGSIREYMKVNLMLEDALNEVKKGNISVEEMEKIMLDFS